MTTRHAYAHAALDQGKSTRRGRRRSMTFAERVDASYRATVAGVVRPVSAAFGLYSEGPARTTADLAKIGPGGFFEYAPPEL